MKWISTSFRVKSCPINKLVRMCCLNANQTLWCIHQNWIHVIFWLITMKIPYIQLNYWECYINLFLFIYHQNLFNLFIELKRWWEKREVLSIVNGIGKINTCSAFCVHCTDTTYCRLTLVCRRVYHVRLEVFLIYFLSTKKSKLRQMARMRIFLIE